MSTRFQLSIAAALAVALLAFAASIAQAASYEQAEFKAEVKGVQTFQSEYHVESTGPCEPSIDQSTSERIKFRSIRPVKLTITKLPQLREPVITSGQRVLRIPTTGKVTRSNSNSVGSIDPGCPDNGGGSTPTPPDCGTKTVTPWRMSVDYYKPDHVELQPEDVAGSDLFQNCGSGAYPRLLSGATFGKRQSAELPMKEVFDEKIGKLITIGAGDEFLPFSEGSDETKIRWELSLTRLGK